jgi:hypothetical protein
MTPRFNIQLPSDRELSSSPQRSQIATLRVALVLAERALLNQHDVLRSSTVPALGDSRPQSLARMLLSRVRELHALADTYDRLLVCDPPAPDEDDEIDF